MARFLYSDIHFHHPLVAKHRGFTKEETGIDPVSGEEVIIIAGDSEAHDEMILENWNKTVRKDDIIFILGDFAMNWQGVSAKLARMKGRKILIEGNHDIMWSGHRNGWKLRARWTGEDRFEAIQPYAIRKSGGQEFLMSHFPYQGDHTGEDRHAQFRLRDEGKWLLHGHTHSDRAYDPDVHPRQLHVGADTWNMTPVLEEEVLEMMKVLDTPTGA